MHSRLLRLVGGSTMWMLGACGAQPTEIELRLYPCDLVSGEPTSVSLQIQSYGPDGAIGEPLRKTFPIPAEKDVFDDKFATVGFTPPAGTLSADITVTWIAGEEMVQAVYNKPLPALGEVLALGEEECEGVPGTTSTPTTVDPTTAGPGTSETDPTTETGTTTTTDPTETTSTSTSTTETTSTSTTEETTTTTTSTTDTTETTMGTSGDPMEGGDCPVDFEFACDAGPGALGKLLQCQMGKWALNDTFCDPSKCADAGFADPQVVGCMGWLMDWSCACADTPKSECSMGMESQCGEAIGDGVKVELCVEDADKTYHYVAICPKCEEVDGEPLCLVF